MNNFSPIYGQNPTTGAQEAIQTDGNHRLEVAGSITATNPSVGPTGAAVPADATLVGASDGTHLQPLLVDGSGNLKISGSITATNPSVGANTSATPTSSTAIGGSDGTNLQQALVESASHPNMRFALYNGANETAVDASGNLSTTDNLAKVGGAAIALGQAAMASSIPVAIANNQSAIPVSQSGTWTIQPGNTPNTSAWLTQPVAGTTGGSTPSHAISAASTNATSVKASAGTLYGITVSNTNAAARFFKLYDKASAPTVGTDTPKSTIQVPPNSTVARAYPVGMAFALGIAYAATTGIADTDTGSIGASDLSMDVDYK